MVPVEITNEQKIQITLAPKTAAGNPAPVDGKPTWTIQSGSSTIEVAEDGMSAFLISSDEESQTMVLIEADAKVGDGVESISETIQLTVKKAQAANFGLVIGLAIPK